MWLFKICDSCVEGCKSSPLPQHPLPTCKKMAGHVSSRCRGYPFVPALMYHQCKHTSVWHHQSALRNATELQWQSPKRGGAQGLSGGSHTWLSTRNPSFPPLWNQMTLIFSENLTTRLVHLHLLRWTPTVFSRNNAKPEGYRKGSGFCLLSVCSPSRPMSTLVVGRWPVCAENKRGGTHWQRCNLGPHRLVF